MPARSRSPLDHPCSHACIEVPGGAKSTMPDPHLVLEPHLYRCARGELRHAEFQPNAGRHP
jgi:hypothetical protein